MPECYKCKNKSCGVPFSEMPTCYVNQSCYTQSKILENKKGEQILVFERGCEDYGNNAQLSMCHIYDVSAKHLFHDLHLNCCVTNKCNNVSFQSLELTRPFTEPTEIFTSIKISSLFFIIFLLCAIGICTFKKRRAKKNKNNNDIEMEEAQIKLCQDIEFLPNKKGENDSNSEYCDNKPIPVDSQKGELSSDFKSCLHERTLCKDIRLDLLIGNGRYGKVYRAQWKSDMVAVKILYSQDYVSFTRELEIYQAMNSSISRYVLNFLASDITSDPEHYGIQLWLITDYCPLGSLFDFLSENTLTLNAALSIINSILCGMFYLHEDKYVSGNKPAIAHRDIKSKNILMASPTECVIADFGLAVTYYNGGELNVPVNYRVGTKRYMAPEILNNTFNPAKFSSYLMADVYSIGLVLWEIIHRIEVFPDIEAQPFRVAYQDMVQPDPSFEEMNHVVCKLNCRPKIEDVLFKHEILAGIIRMIQESWKTKPTSRVTIYYIKKQLGIAQ